jgi:hypothetical protein
LSNAAVVYGVLELHWNFFMVVYSYWFGELISSIFDKIKFKTLQHRDESLVITESNEGGGRFFFLFLYWVFIVVIVGFLTAPDNMYFENFMVLLFRNVFFNISLLFLLLGELFIYVKIFYFNRNYDPKRVIAKNGIMNKKTMVMHLSIIFGTFAWFAMNSDKFFFRIDAGKYGSYSFIIVFIVVRLAGDLMSIRAEYKSE